MGESLRTWPHMKEELSGHLFPHPPPAGGLRSLVLHGSLRKCPGKSGGERKIGAMEGSGAEPPDERRDERDAPRG